MLTQQEELRIARAPRDDEHWDMYVRQAPDSQHSHLSGWRPIIEDVLGREYIPLVAVTPDGDWQGVLPLVRVRTPLLGHSIISLPYLNYGGPVGGPSAQVQLLAAAVAEAQQTRAGMLQLRCRSELAALAAAADPAPRNGRSEHPAEQRIVAPGRKTLVLLDLPDSAETLWASFPAKLRSQIRRPQKEGVQFRVGTDQLDAFYGVFSRNMRDLGTPVYPRRFFEAIADTFDDAVFGAVYLDGKPIGAACGFLWRGEFEMTWASTIRDYNRIAPNMLLYWGFMEEMIRRGARLFNFGRSTPGASTHRFKLQWGSRDVPLPWLEWSTNPKPSRTTESPLIQFASAAWRRLPLRIANWVGPAFAPRLPWW